VFFQAMVPVRSEVALLEEVKTQDHKAQMIWTVLQCHAIVDQFIALDFKGHTSMVQQMTLYMMTERVDPVQMVKLASTAEMGQKGIVKAMKLFKTLTSDHKKLKTESASHKRRLDDVFDQLEVIKKKVVAVKL
jgi:transcriptional regulator with GAF, ATPase, and Fis domain